MKKIFIVMIMAAIMVGCHKDNITGDTPPVQEGRAATYSAKLTLNVGQNVTKAFDEDLKWMWEEGDVIIGYQNSGDKTLNKLTFKGGNTFECEEFVYSTQEPAEFCFFYGEVDNDGQYITAIQDDGTWRPVLFGSIDNVTLPNIGDVYMSHKSSAIEFQLFFNKDDDTPFPFNIKEAKLTSNKEFVGKWKLYNMSEKVLSGDEITITLPELSNTNAVVFNVPPITEIFGDDENTTFTITFTTFTDETIERSFNASEFQLVEGYSITYKIDAEVYAELPLGPTVNTAIREKIGDCTKIKFIANSVPSDISSNISSNVFNDDVPVYLVKNDGTLEFHTPADKFKAQTCEKMFQGLSSVTAIDFAEVFDASDVTSMDFMFDGCESLKEITFKGFSTGTLVMTGMQYMFRNCKTMGSIDMTMFSFKRLVRSADMFEFNANDQVTVTVASKEEHNFLKNKNNLGKTTCYMLTIKKEGGGSLVPII